MMCAVRFIHLPLLCLIFSAALACKSEGGISETKFDTFAPDGEVDGVLVLVPGYNGSGKQMLDARWEAFAEKNRLVLLAPTFIAEGMENNEGRGYYYPEQGSGKVMERAIAEAGKRYGVRTEKVLMFGVSAGAHFTHRFAIWNPERVAAFVAYSAGWWSLPAGRIKNVPALIMCGEEDPRYEASYAFFVTIQHQLIVFLTDRKTAPCGI